ncbi:pleckstrin homology domain-containing family A member 6 [Antennarius striatus]|uniref:pleckstrin homology domain-containing family A member 6 n=1 Tax=Antennarius striatus TaxID=241820 RepID=UPI0035AD8589
MEGQRQENVVLRRDFWPRTAPERVAQRKSSMAQLHHWVNLRRAMAVQEDINSPFHYYTVGHGVWADCHDYPGGLQYEEDYPLYLTEARPGSICSVSAVGGCDRDWTPLEKHHSMYGPPKTTDHWGPQYSGRLETSMRHLSIHPFSWSVPRSQTSLCGHHSPVPSNFTSPCQSSSAHFHQFPGRMRNDLIYADRSTYGLRRSLSSPKHNFAGNRRSLNQGLHHYSYPVSPSITNKVSLFPQMSCFHDNHGRELHPTLKLNEIETSKLLNRLCEQNRILKDHEAVVHRLKIDKESLEEALVWTHQEIEREDNQPLSMKKLKLKKGSLQNQLITIRGELSQASGALTTIRMEFEALEDEASAIHGDLWEQLNAGGQSELIRKHFQKEFCRVQDVLERLHKNCPSRGTDRANLTETRSFTSSLLSSLSCTNPLSTFSSMPGTATTQQLSPEEIVPPRPPLPKSYHPMDPPFTCSPLPFDDTAWLHSFGIDEDCLHDDDSHIRKPYFREQNHITDASDNIQDRQFAMNKVGIVTPRTKFPTNETHCSATGLSRCNEMIVNEISRVHPKSAMFSAEMKVKMSVEEQNERIRQNQRSSMRAKRRSLNLSGGQPQANYDVARRRLTAHEIDIKDLEAAVRGQEQESPREEIARLRRLQVDLDISKGRLASDEILIPEDYLDAENNNLLSPEEQKEKQKKLERIKTLIAKSNLQNMIPNLDKPLEGRTPNSSQQQLKEQEKRIEISCTLAAEASHRSRLLSAQFAAVPLLP